MPRKTRRAGSSLREKASPAFHAEDNMYSNAAIAALREVAMGQGGEPMNRADFRGAIG
jgi:hypothetical protein